MWRSRLNTRKELLAKCGDSWSRKKSIYYDEEGIREEQIETAHYCRQCSGYLTIRTAAAGTRFGDQSAFIVSLKRDTCSECRQTAYDEAQLEKRNGKWQYVLVQHIADGEIESL